MFHIIVRDNCQWCDKAKALLDERGLPYKTYNVGGVLTDFRYFIRAIYKTVPQIWYEGDKHNDWIGEYEDLKDYLDTLD